MGFIDKAKAFVSTHQGQTRSGIKKAGEVVNKQTKGKYAGQISQGQRMLNEKLGLGSHRPGRKPPTGRDQANP